MTDKEITSLLQERIKETRAELKRLENGLQALTGETVAEQAKPKTSTGARRGRPPKAASTGARRGRPPKAAAKAKAPSAAADSAAAPSGKRQNQYLKAVGKNPGMTTAEVAAKIGVTKPHGYALAKVMRERKLIEVKDGKNYPVSGPASQAKAPAKAVKAPAKKTTGKKPARRKAKAPAKK